jgi:hypothetical protein
MIACRRIRVHYSRLMLYSTLLKVVAPKAIVECHSGIVSPIVFAFVGAILLVFDLSYITFFMTSVSTSLCVSANRFVGSIVIFTIFDR